MGIRTTQIILSTVRIHMNMYTTRACDIYIYIYQDSTLDWVGGLVRRALPSVDVDVEVHQRGRSGRA